MLELSTWQEVHQLYARYVSAIDAEDWQSWIDCFTDDCRYQIIPRENHEQGLPLGLLDLKTRAMLQDRVYGITETLFHDPYYQRHIVGLPLILRSGGDTIDAEANYTVMRTKADGATTVFNAGRYLDQLVLTNQGWRFRSRICIYDSEMVPNSLIYPI
mgnify:CR=1 FL=1